MLDVGYRGFGGALVMEDERLCWLCWRIQIRLLEASAVERNTVSQTRSQITQLDRGLPTTVKLA